jgi:hypothetical protein
MARSFGRHGGDCTDSIESQVLSNQRFHDELTQGSFLAGGRRCGEGSESGDTRFGSMSGDGFVPDGPMGLILRAMRYRS